ncbi:trafficking protein particle complex subunit 9 [Caerostris extrusa]|uniref:Trafficking protein particle complex subunit 9 n=1 Tax=Caerostris extrusa TaxID=172846 RepID=A0AAV4NBT4_CAEEX|nr:trafficking protein particle complex subunit 9 [Caerostris extrusa]
MSVPDYDLRAEDHRTVLVLVKQIGDKINKNLFCKIFERIKSVQYLTVKEYGSTRYIWFRHETDYPPENNEWGDFQTHRKVLGLISIGKKIILFFESNCNAKEYMNAQQYHSIVDAAKSSMLLENSGPENVEELSKEHSILIEKYNNSMFDSRCFVFNTDSVSPSDVNESKFSLDDKAISPDCTHSPLTKSDTADTSLKDLDELGFSDFSSLPSFHSTNSNDISYSFDTRESLSSNSSPSEVQLLLETHQLQKFYYHLQIPEVPIVLYIQILITVINLEHDVP